MGSPERWRPSCSVLEPADQADHHPTGLSLGLDKPFCAHGIANQPGHRDRRGQRQGT